VTGGTGFVGSHLIDTLCDGELRPRVLVRSRGAPRWIGGQPVEWIEGNLEDQESLVRLVAGCTTVIHLAGVVRAGRVRDFDEGNRIGTERLVEAVSRAAPAARLVHVSSLAAVGPSADPVGLGPEAEAHPISAYGRSKRRAEEAVIAGCGEWVILRPPAIYGPRDTDVFEFFRLASRGLAVAPAGERWVTVAYVRDVVRAILSAAVEPPPGSILHIGEEQPRCLDALLGTLAAAGQRRIRVIRIPQWLVLGAGAGGSALHRLGFRSLALTADKARELVARHWSAQTAGSARALGIASWTPFEEGAAETWSWYRNEGWLP
jgi:nucleoside-diphosphate-sugar epimerase